MLAHLPKQTAFNLGGGAKDGGGGSGGVEKHSRWSIERPHGRSAMWGQFKSGWNKPRKQAQQSGTVGCAAQGRTQESQWCILAALAAQFWIQSDDLTSLVQTKISQNHHEILYRRSWFPDDTSPCLQKDVSSGSTWWIIYVTFLGLLWLSSLLSFFFKPKTWTHFPRRSPLHQQANWLKTAKRKVYKNLFCIFTVFISIKRKWTILLSANRAVVHFSYTNLC